MYRQVQGALRLHATKCYNPIAEFFITSHNNASDRGRRIDRERQRDRERKLMAGTPCVLPHQHQGTVRNHSPDSHTAGRTAVAAAVEAGSPVN